MQGSPNYSDVLSTFFYMGYASMTVRTPSLYKVREIADPRLGRHSNGYCGNKSVFQYATRTRIDRSILYLQDDANYMFQNPFKT